MKVNCGIDIIEIDRIKESIEKTGENFLNKVFTKKEIEYCESKKKQKYQHYAARFATKEAAFKALKVRQRLTIQMNFIAFFCSWIYLFVLGLWKKAIIVLLLGILSLFVGALIGVNILGIAVAAYVAVNTNKWFYEKEVKGLNTWSL